MIQLSSIPNNKENLPLLQELNNMIANNPAFINYYTQHRRRFPSAYDLNLRITDTWCFFIERIAMAKNAPRFLVNLWFYNESSNGYDHFRTTVEDPTQYGLYIAQKTEASFIDFTNDYNFKRLKAMEESLKINQNNRIQIHYNTRILYVQTNSTPTVEHYYKIKLLQWTLINKDFPDTNCEKLIEFYTALHNNDLKAVNTVLNKIIDLKEIKKNKYTSYEKYFISDKKSKLETLKYRIERIKEEIVETENRLKELMTNLKTKFHEYNVANTMDDEIDFSMILNYLVNHPYIQDIEPYDGDHKIMFHYDAPILYYDAELAKSTTKHYEAASREVIDVLIDDRYTLWTKCAIVFNTYNFALNRYEVGDSSTRLRHPHIDRYGCFGNHDNAIASWIENRDYFGCIDQISAAVLNLNFADSIVVSNLISNILTHRSIPTFYDNVKETFVSYNEIMEEKLNGKTQTDTE